MGDSGAEQFIPQKRYVKQTSTPIQKPKIAEPRGIGQKLKSTGQVAAAAIGLSSSIFPAQAKNTADYVVHHLPSNTMIRQVDKSIDARYPQLVDPRDSQVAQATPTPEKLTDDPAVELLYPGLTEQEKQELSTQLEPTIDRISKNYLTDEAITRIKNLQPLFDKYKDLGVPSDLLRGMAIVESTGNQYAYNQQKDSGGNIIGQAKGVFQITDKMALAYGLTITNYDLDDPNYDPAQDPDQRYKLDTSFRVAVSELSQAHDNRWPEVGWAYPEWEWHAGAVNIYRAVDMYVGDKGEEVLSLKTADSYRTKMSSDHINLFRLLNDPVVREAFSGSEWDDTLDYDLLGLAGVLVFKQKTGQIRHASSVLQDLPKAA